MEAVASQFKELVESANRILVTSHISPDPDAVCATLLVGRTLKLNFSDKEIRMVLEEKPSRDLLFLAGGKDVLGQETDVVFHDEIGHGRKVRRGH